MALVETATSVVPPRKKSCVFMKTPKGVLHAKVAHMTQCVAFWRTHMSGFSKLGDIPYVAIVGGNIEIASHDDIVTGCTCCV